MKVAAITINKGGAGKTMLSRSLGTAAAAAGKLVLILDMDTQQNSTNWRRRRPDELPLPHVQFTTENDLEATLKRARDAGCDLVLIADPLHLGDRMLRGPTADRAPRPTSGKTGGRGTQFYPPLRAS